MNKTEMKIKIGAVKFGEPECNDDIMMDVKDPSEVKKELSKIEHNIVVFNNLLSDLTNKISEISKDYGDSIEDEDEDCDKVETHKYSQTPLSNYIKGMRLSLDSSIRRFKDILYLIDV